MQQRNDEIPFVVVHADGSLGSASWDQVFSPLLLEDPEPREMEPQPSQLSLEDALDAEIDKEPAPRKRAQQTQQTLHQVLRPKAKAKQPSSATSTSTSTFDFQKALQGLQGAGGPRSSRACAEGLQGAGGPRSSRACAARVARAGLMIEETEEAVRIVDLGEPGSTASTAEYFWDVVSGEE
eukprot:s14_g20.t1